MRRLFHLPAGLLVAVVAAGLSACASTTTTTPDTFSVGRASVSHLRTGQAVTLSNAYRAEAPVSIQVGGHAWGFEQRQMTETAIVMLRRGLELQGINAAPVSAKTITLRVHSPLPVVRTIGLIPQFLSSVTLDAEYGDGTRSSVIAENQSPVSAQRSFEGATLFCLNKLVMDEKFVSYMNK